MANRHMKRSSASLPPGRCKSKPPRDSASHLSERLLLRRQEITSAVEDVKGKEPHHCGWECKRTQPLWETVGKQYGVPQETKLNTGLPWTQTFSFWVSIRREKTHTLSQKDTCTCNSLQHYLQLPRHESNLSVHPQMLDHEEWFIYTMKYYSAIRSEILNGWI